MRIFVTGATGVIGRRIVPRLLDAGHSVTGVVRNAEQRNSLERQGAAASDVDLFAPATLPAALAGHDVLVNLATHIPSSSARMLLPGAWRENDRLRSKASRYLATAARQAGVTRFIQESFAPVYPSRGDAWIDEDTPLAPARYSRSVADAERSAQQFTEAGGAGVVLRFASFYGADSTFTHEMIQLVHHGFVPLFGPPETFISSVSHDDAANAVLTALNVPAGAYNVSDDEPVTHRAFADALAEAVGAPSPRLPPAWATRLAGSIGKTLSRSQRISNAKLRGCGWTPKYRSVREGFQQVARDMHITVIPDAGAAGAGTSR